MIRQLADWDSMWQLRNKLDTNEKIVVHIIADFTYMHDYGCPVAKVE
jgi:hypothetical protein